MSAADAAAANPNGMSTILANIVHTYFINFITTFIQGSQILTRNPPAFSRLKNYLSANNNLCGKSALLVPNTFDDKLLQ